MNAMTVAGSSTYLYVNDESQHGGIHRWRLDGLNTEAELTGRGPLDSTIILAGTAPANRPPAAPGVPDKVIQLTAAAGRGNVFLSWTPAPTGPTATYFQVRRANAPNGLFQIIATSVFQNDFTDSRVTNGSTYSYEIVPVNSNGAGAPSRPATARPGATSNVYEAESGVLVGTHVRPDRYASGNVEVADSKESSVTISHVNGGAGGSFVLDIRYSWPFGTWTRASLQVNGKEVALPAFPKTPEGPPVFGDVTVKIHLQPGTGNSLVMTDAPILDKFTVTAVPQG
jgi:hypothetical protein